VAAVYLSAATECLIRRYPVQWTHWSALQYRWNEAKDAWSEMDRLLAKRGAPHNPGPCDPVPVESSPPQTGNAS
jgi:hypothetical protein